jgi:hypothetical protein
LTIFYQYFNLCELLYGGATEFANDKTILELALQHKPKIQPTKKSAVFLKRVQLSK